MRIIKYLIFVNSNTTNNSAGAHQGWTTQWPSGKHIHNCRSPALSYCCRTPGTSRCAPSPASLSPQIVFLKRKQNWLINASLLPKLNIYIWQKTTILSIPSWMLLCRWLIMAARIVDRFMTWAHWASPRVKSSFQQALTKLVFASWLKNTDVWKL